MSETNEEVIVGSNSNSEMLRELRQVNSERGGKKTEDLPEGTAPIEAKVEEVEVASEEKPLPEGETIRIGDQEFKTQAEAIRYAEKLENEKLALEMYNQGIRDTLSANAPAVQAAPEEDPELEFYKDPVAAMKKAKDQAKNELRSELQQEKERNRLWDKFLTKNPDIEKEDAERILAKNWDTMKLIADEDKAMDLLATKTRADYQRIIERAKPRTELPNKSGQAVSAGSSSPASVTPKKKEEAPLDFASQIRMMRRKA